MTSPPPLINPLSVTPLLQANQLASRQEHVTSLYRLADNCVLMAPAWAIASGTLPSLFQWAIQAVQLREAEPLRCVIGFLSHWAAPSSGLLTETDKQVGSAGVGVGARGRGAGVHEGKQDRVGLQSPLRCVTSFFSHWAAAPAGF